MIEKLKRGVQDLLKSRMLWYYVLLTALVYIPTFVFSWTAYPGAVVLHSNYTTFVVSLALISILYVLYNRYLQIVIVLLYSLFLFVNSVYCRQFGDVIPISLYTQATNLLKMDSGSVTNLFQLSDLVVAVVLILGCGLLLFIRSGQSFKLAGRARFSVLGLALLLFAVMSMSFFGLIERVKICLWMPRSQVVKIFTIPVVCGKNYHYRFKIVDVPIENRNKAICRLREIAAENALEVERVADGSRDLIVVLVESLNSKGLTEESMPFCYELTQDSTSIYVPHLEQNIGVGTSMDGQMITLSGQKPREDTFLFNVNSEVELPSVTKCLKRYNKSYVSSLSTITDTLFWLQNIAARAMLIDHRYGKEEGGAFKDDKLKYWQDRNCWIKDDDLFESVIEKIGALCESGNPYVYTIITGDSHNPFDDDREPLHPITSYKLGEEMYHYYVSLQYTDREIERLFDFLESKNRLENTTVLIASDHSWTIAGSGCSGRDMQMLIYNPVNRSDYRPKRVPQQISIYPTLLWAMGIVDSTYMGLTPPMTSPRIEEFGEEELKEASYLSELIQYNNLLAE